MRGCVAALASTCVMGPAEGPRSRASTSVVVFALRAHREAESSSCGRRSVESKSWRGREQNKRLLKRGDDFKLRAVTGLSCRGPGTAGQEQLISKLIGLNNDGGKPRLWLLLLQELLCSCR